MNKTLLGLISAAGIAGVIAGVSLPSHKETKAASPFPETRDNQQLIRHADYLSGLCAPSYTLLTDMDRDGSWDIADRVHSGFTPGDYTRELFFKKGYGPARSVEGVTNMQIVEPEFFKPYQ